ncbi:MarR family transcriptional regulator [Ruminococcus sp. FC2018]|uniref:MarR family winged helix-turn-helix transcriptional regulator n=1 Tax=Ruminococcus sp. FC2018 TaxID=1410617 RepID=UPI0005698D13|nr:MarR family transcriptional regulator [Ruminococcus sp. FC2018]
MTNNEYPALRLENQLCFPLYACARQIVKQYTPYLKPLGLTYTQYILMMVLWEGGSPTMGELGRRLFLDSGTLTPMLKKLEKQGYLKRKREKKDERVVRISLTQQGWDLREAVKDVPACVAHCVNLSIEELESIYGILYKMLGHFEEGSDEDEYPT